ncbi:hypothetical protein BZA70DRAFT_257413 [Myxozyma melibiosi]|uniref:RING-type E3 ubiquitin transferase n=1 Tax=Myxozyma melibiosi TaxID=54550 RepID=A0ABR1F6Z0_9ASCO
MPPIDPNRAGLLVFLLIIMLLTPESASPSQRSAFQEFLKAQRHRRDVLLNATFEEGPVDLEGISNPVLPYELQSMASDLWESQQPTTSDGADSYSFYHNITGLVRGEWEISDLNVDPMELSHSSEYVLKTPRLNNVTGAVMWESSGDNRNITDREGIMTLDIGETRPGPVQMIEANLNIQDKQGKNGHDIPLRGIHFVDTGNIVMATTSRKFAGLYSLPFLTLTEERFNQSYTPFMTEINRTISELEAIYRRDINPAVSSSSSASESCEYIVYLQIHSSPLSPEEMSVVEDELRFPKGQPHEDIPKIEISSLVYSPNCGIVLESRLSVGDKIEQFWSQASHAALVAGCLTVIQIWLLIRQMNDTNTPSTVSKLSFWTIELMSLVDGYLCMGYLAAAVFMESTFLPFMTVAFLTFLLVSVFGMRYLILIYRIQRPENRRQQAAAAAQTAATTANNDGGLPLPATATPQTEQANMGSGATPDDDGRSDVSLIYSRFYFILLAFIFLTLNASTWPKVYRRAFQHFLFLSVNSYWVPQIYRNVMRGCRRAFKWEFVLGMSVIRLIPMLYLYLYENNIIFQEVEPVWAMIISCWVWLQICVLAAQEILGPRFFVPGNFLPPSYDYHPPLSIPDLESRAALGDDLPTISTDSQGGVVVMGPTDCAICMQPIELPSELFVQHDHNRSGAATSSSSASALLARRNYMVTPCRHIFHTQCLESWMRFKLQCPTCRNPLPPL